MSFIETRGNDGVRAKEVEFSHAILNPSSSFGGLYVPKDIPALGTEFITKHLNTSYKELAFDILKDSGITFSQDHTDFFNIQDQDEWNDAMDLFDNNEIEIYTDSQYVRLGITEWIHKWIKNNWQTSKKEPVKNKELWMQLYELTKSYKIKWIWVKAHAGNALNEEVDLLAKKAAELN